MIECCHRTLPDSFCMSSMIIYRKAEAPFPNCEVPQLISQCQHSSQVPARMFCILVPCPRTDTHTLFGKGNRRLSKISRDLEGKQTINEAAAGKSSPRLRQGVILCLNRLCVLLPWESGLSGGILSQTPLSGRVRGPPLSALLSKGSCLCPCPPRLTHCPLFFLAGKCPAGKGSDQLRGHRGPHWPPASRAQEDDCAFELERR